MKIKKILDKKINMDINGIKTDSRLIKKGDIFACTLGLIDKHKFINDAIKRGCKLVLTNRDISNNIKYIKFENLENDFKNILDEYYHYPLENKNLIGVTGTDGKTTIVTILRYMLEGASIGTNGLEYFDYEEDLYNTTPSLDKLYECFNKIGKENISNIIMEVSSESYLTKRIPNLKFNIGVFTNITNEHLDKHKDFDDYFNCKMKLLENSDISVINHDSKYFKEIIKHTNNYVTYGKRNSTITLLKYKLKIDKTLIWFKYQKKKYYIESPLLGKFNVENILACILVLLKLNYSIEEIIKRISLIKNVKGRLELIQKNNKNILIDYAHTINATKNILEFVKKYSHKKIITVVGCAGGRYKDKRKIIGKLTLKYSWKVIFTTDDPRWENACDIIKDMLNNTKKKNYYVIINRMDAIKLGYHLLDSNSILLILGKGRDKYMAIKNKKIPYSDIDVLENIINSSC